MNPFTASASELVAGALQDHDRALVAGRPTFGKSLLMRGFPLVDGSVIIMAFGRVKTPCGRVVQREYRSQSRHDYYRLAGAVRDTAGRPNCRTTGGRTVYGGGGVYPDVLLDPPALSPVWLARLAESDVPLAWVGGYLSGVTIPSDAEAESRLERMLLARLAYAKFGEAGYYRLITVVDPVVRRAIGSFAEAADLPGRRD